MTQVFLKDGTMVPVTVVKAGPCGGAEKKQLKETATTAFSSVFEEVAEKKLNKPELGHLKAAGVQPLKILKEFDLSNADSLEDGTKSSAATSRRTTFMDVTAGTTKGRGFFRVIKLRGSRGFSAANLKETHGVGDLKISKW